MNNLSFPLEATAQDPIPEAIWPSNEGVLQAGIIAYGSTEKGWTEFLKVAKRPDAKIVSIDDETSGLRPFHGSRMAGLAMAVFSKAKIHAGYFNFGHVGHSAHSWCKDRDEHDQRRKEKKKVVCQKCLKDESQGRCPGYKETTWTPGWPRLKEIEPLLSKPIGGQNFKFDIKQNSVHGVPLPDGPMVLDTMLIAHLYDENKRGYHLAGLAQEMGDKKLGDTIKEYMEEHLLPIERGHEQVPFSVEQPYAIADTVLVLKRLEWERLRWLKENDPRLMQAFQVELGSVLPFARAEINGMKLDLEFLRAGISHLEGELKGIEGQLFKLAGKEFDIMSNDELWAILAARGHQPVATTATGKPRVTAMDLHSYKDEIAELVLAYRSRNKTYGTYFKPFHDHHADPKGFLHADFFIHGTVSGRASCREPNLQNITRFEKFSTLTKSGSVAAAIQSGLSAEDTPVEDVLEVRRCFIPRSKDHALIFLDYAQMELRVFADYAEEEYMIEALAKGQDIHEATARKVFTNFPEKEKNPKLYEYFRQLAKQINFGIIYGMGRGKLAMQLQVPLDEVVRTLRLCQLAWEKRQQFSYQNVTTYTIEEIGSLLVDHDAMFAARQWDGLRRLQREVEHKTNTREFEAWLEKVDPASHQRLMYSAEKFLKQYHSTFPKIKKFTKAIEEAIGRRGYVFNKYGRRYHLPTNQAYVGVNRLIQGSCADMVKLAQHRLDQLFKGTRSMVINQVHDEIQVDLHRDDVDLVEKARKLMEYFPNLKVKMKVDVDFALTSWAEKIEWEGADKFKEAFDAHRQSRAQEKSSRRGTKAKPRRRSLSRAA